MTGNRAAALIIFLLLTRFACADIMEKIQDLSASFSLEFREEHPDLVFRPNLGIVPFSNDSPEAEKYRIAEAVTSIIENSFGRSLIFNLVEEKERERMLGEMKFALSGLSDTDRIEVGKLEGIDYFVLGSVSQVGEEFLITMKVAEVNSSKVIFSGNVALPKYDIIDYSEKLAAAYVSPYGIGVEFNQVAFYRLDSEMSDIEGQIVEGWPMCFSLNYRISRNLLTWFGVELTTGAFRLADTYESTEYTAAAIENMTSPPPSLYYHKERTYFASFLGLGYVFNVNRSFNITLGGELTLGMSFLQQFYNYTDGTVDVEHTVESQDMTMFLVSPVVKLQYFITPRVALNALYSRGFQIPREDENVYFYASTSASTFTELEGLNPDIGPDGEPHITDFSGHRVRVGVGFYF